MLERIVAQIAVALLAWIDRRIERSSVAVDADVDRDRLERAGRRIDEWLRQQDDLRARGKPDEGRSAR